MSTCVEVGVSDPGRYSREGDGCLEESQSEKLRGQRHAIGQKTIIFYYPIIPICLKKVYLNFLEIVDLFIQKVICKSNYAIRPIIKAPNFVERYKPKQHSYCNNSYCSLSTFKMKKNYLNAYDSDASFDEKKLVEGQARLKELSPLQYEMHPYNSIGVILTYIGGRPAASSGSLISSNLVLTTAHSIIFLSDNNQIIIPKSKDIVFYPQLCGKLDHVKAAKVVDYRLCPEYQQIIRDRQQLSKQKLSAKADKNLQRVHQIKNQLLRLRKQSERYDYALLKLQKAITLEEYVSLRALEPGEAPPVELCGYINNGMEYNIYESVVKNEEPSPTIEVTETGGLYDLDTSQGQSGCPVFVRQTKKEIIGIHKGYDPVVKKNICTLVSPKMLANLEKWTKDFFLFKCTTPYNQDPLQPRNSQILGQASNQKYPQLSSQNKELRNQIQVLKLTIKQLHLEIQQKQKLHNNNVVAAEEYYQKGRTSKQPAQQEEYYRKAIALNPHHSYAYNNLGSLCYSSNRLKEAEELYKKAIQLDPKDSMVHYNLGLLCFNSNRLNEAENLLRKTIQLDPNNPYAYNSLGNLCRSLKRLKEAEQLYRKAIHLNPNQVLYQQNLREILKKLGK